MSAEVIKFPCSASRRVHSRKPRRSKNGTPEQRASRVEVEAAKLVTAPVVDLSEMMTEEPVDRVDRRKLRGSPLREKIPDISFAATVVGKMHTADLRGEPLPHDAAGWLEVLHAGAAAARYVADKLDKAYERLKASVGTESSGRRTRPMKRGADRSGRGSIKGLH